MNAVAELLRNAVLAAGPNWRAPVVQVFFSGAVRNLVVLAIGFIGFGSWILVERPLSIINVNLSLGILTAIGLCQGAVGGDRRPSRWSILFQVPVSPVHFYFRALALRWIVASILLAATTAAFSAMLLVTKASPRLVLGTSFGAWIAASVLLAVGFGVSSLVRRSERSAVLLLLVLSIMQVALVHALQIDQVPLVREVLRFALIPVDAFVALMQALVSGGTDFGMVYLGQLMLYPLAWLGVAVLRLRHFATADVPMGLDE